MSCPLRFSLRSGAIHRTLFLVRHAAPAPPSFPAKQADAFAFHVRLLRTCRPAQREIFLLSTLLTLRLCVISCLFCSLFSLATGRSSTSPVHAQLFVIV